MIGRLFTTITLSLRCAGGTTVMRCSRVVFRATETDEVGEGRDVAVGIQAAVTQYVVYLRRGREGGREGGREEEKGVLVVVVVVVVVVVIIVR